MAAVWNIKDLRPPPNLTYEIQLSDISKYIENIYFNLERLTEVKLHSWPSNGNLTQYVDSEHYNCRKVKRARSASQKKFLEHRPSLYCSLLKGLYVHNLQKLDRYNRFANSMRLKPAVMPGVVINTPHWYTNLLVFCALPLLNVQLIKCISVCLIETVTVCICRKSWIWNEHTYNVKDKNIMYKLITGSLSFSMKHIEY
jgi:hypothetical protein